MNKQYKFSLTKDVGVFTEVIEAEDDLQAGLKLKEWILENADAGIEDVTDKGYETGRYIMTFEIDEEIRNEMKERSINKL